MAEEDDGFQDFLSEDDEECALQQQEAAAMERRMRSLGVRDGLEFGKEDTLQQGFDAGFAVAATRSHRFGALRGALSAALVCGLFDSESDAETAKALTETLRSLAKKTATTLPITESAAQPAEAAPASPGGDVGTAAEEEEEEEEEEEAVAKAARTLLDFVHVEVPDL